MDSDGINLIMDEARDYWIAQTGNTSLEDFDAAGAIALYCDFDRQELNAIANYVSDWAFKVLARFIEDRINESGNDRGSMDSEELIHLVIEAAMPVTMCVARHRAGNRRVAKKGDEYITTVFAEAHVNSVINSDGDLNEIWPQTVIEEVLARFSPEDAFRVGVLCGQNG